VVKVGDPASGSGMRNMALEKLNAEGIGAGVHYPVALHRTKAFEHLGYRRGAFPNAEDAADRVLSLPLYPNITAGQQERVVETLLAAVG
jgi:dTDP-4-amino-4,6-dideoxygalactose transaminase